MGLVTTVQDSLNDHVSIRILLSPGADADDIADQAKALMKRHHLTTWGWETRSDTVLFRVYEPDNFTARGRLEQAKFKLKK